MNLLKVLSNGSIDDVANICKMLGVNITNNDGSYKTVDIVFNELSAAWNKMKK